MGGTYLGICKVCEEDTDLIMGVCSDCSLNVDKTSEKLISVLCNPKGKVCIRGSEEDRKILQECIEEVKKIEQIGNLEIPQRGLCKKELIKFLGYKLSAGLKIDLSNLAQALITAYDKNELFKEVEG